jgi:hypothetical protein
VRAAGAHRPDPGGPVSGPGSAPGPDHDRLTRVLLRLVEDARRVPKRSGGWPHRREWEARRRRWPLGLRDPERAVVRLLEGAFVRGDPDLGNPFTPAEVRAAVRTVVTALALEGA